MSKDTRTWTVVVLVGLALVAIRCLMAGEVVGKEYVRKVTTTFVEVPDEAAAAEAIRTGRAPIQTNARGEPARWIDLASDEGKKVQLDTIPPEGRMDWVTWQSVTPLQARDARDAAAAGQPTSEVRLSVGRTVGVWFAAFLTLALFSFLYKDNPIYKVAEAIFIGCSAAYWMVVAFHTTIIPNLFGKLSPGWVQTWAMPGLKEERDLVYIVPAILGIMLLWRLAPVGAWIARWPLALFIGVFCGIRLTGYLHGDFLNQIRNAIVPLYALDIHGAFDPWLSLRNIILVLGVLACLVYFFFSFEHRGLVGRTAKVGIWVLMITFGAGFGYTVMGRIALLAIRLEFLFDDWLWLIDPTNKRSAPEETTAMLTGLAEGISGFCDYS